MTSQNIVIHYIPSPFNSIHCTSAFPLPESSLITSLEGITKIVIVTVSELWYTFYSTPQSRPLFNCWFSLNNIPDGESNSPVLSWPLILMHWLKAFAEGLILRLLLCISLQVSIDFVIPYLSQTANFTPRFLRACRKTSFDKSGRRKSLSSAEFDNALEVLILSRALALSVFSFLSLGSCAPSKITYDSTPLETRASKNESTTR